VLDHAHPCPGDGAQTGFDTILRQTPALNDETAGEYLDEQRAPATDTFAPGSLEVGFADRAQTGT